MQALVGWTPVMTTFITDCLPWPSTGLAWIPRDWHAAKSRASLYCPVCCLPAPQHLTLASSPQKGAGSSNRTLTVVSAGDPYWLPFTEYLLHIRPWSHLPPSLQHSAVRQVKLFSPPHGLGNGCSGQVCNFSRLTKFIFESRCFWKEGPTFLPLSCFVSLKSTHLRGLCVSHKSHISHRYIHICVGPTPPLSPRGTCSWTIEEVSGLLLSCNTEHQEKRFSCLFRWCAVPLLSLLAHTWPARTLHSESDDDS